MILGEHTTCQYFEILAPRWHDRHVLLAAHKVGTHNKIVFTEAPTLQGEWYISGHDVHMCNLGTNGKISVYEVPLKFLEPIEIQPRNARQQVLL